MTNFDLEGKEFIELNKLLKICGFTGTGGEAKLAIANGEALVNGEIETQRRKKIRPGDKLEFRGEKIKVS